MNPLLAQKLRSQGGPPAKRLPATARWALVGVCLWWCKIALLCAWQGDDAFITHRSAANVVEGLGAVWNAGERVQAYTHPLWFGLSVVCHAAFGEAFVSVLMLSAGLVVLAAAAIGVGLGRCWRLGLATALALSTCAAVVDYGVSGLENPLLYVLMIAAYAVMVQLPVPRNLTVGALFVSAVGLTRVDALVMVLPALVVMAAGLRPRRLTVAPLLWGFSPLLLWEVFSVVYYGSPVPNTAIAKLNLAIPMGDLLRQGVRYFAWTLRHDPMTLVITGAGVFAGARWGGKIERALVAGVLLYWLYVLQIGGDFMGGRFFAAPAVLGAALWARCAPPWGSHRWPAVATLTLAFVIGLGVTDSRWRTDAHYGVGRPVQRSVEPSGIADERAIYQPTTGLVRNWIHWDALRSANEPIPPFPGARKGHRHRHDRGVIVQDEVGFFGYFAGPGTYVVDAWALTDPLLARLPYRPSGRWRVGHYPRPIPRAYLQSLKTGRNEFKDPMLRAAFEDVRLVTRGPLWSMARFAAIWRLWTGAHAEAFDKASRARPQVIGERAAPQRLSQARGDRR